MPRAKREGLIRPEVTLDTADSMTQRLLKEQAEGGYDSLAALIKAILRERDNQLQGLGPLRPLWLPQDVAQQIVRFHGLEQVGELITLLQQLAQHGLPAPSPRSHVPPEPKVEDDQPDLPPGAAAAGAAWRRKRGGQS